MSKIQHQVIVHVKKSSQNFSLDHGLNRIGFFKFRRYNLRDNFLRLCSINRKRVRVQLGVLLQRKFKDSRLFALIFKSYSAFFLTHVARYFKLKTYSFYDVNTFSYIYFLNRLFLHLDKFLLTFSFYSSYGFTNLNFLFNFLHLLYPGATSKSLIYKLWFQTVNSTLRYSPKDITTNVSYLGLIFLKKNRLFSKAFKFTKTNISERIFSQKVILSTAKYNYTSLRAQTTVVFNNPTMVFNKVRLADSILTHLD